MSTDISNGQYASTVAANRANYFKGSIAVAVIYGVFAISLFLIALFSAKAKELFIGNMLPFVLTLCIGMLVIVAMLTVWLIRYKPPTNIVFEYDNMKCPDYWTLTRSSKTDLNYVGESDKYRAKYKCVRDGNITFPEGNLSVDEDTNLQKIAIQSNTRSPSALSCNSLYPDLMSYYDIKANPDTPNKDRCEYANQCGVSWTSVCPSPPV